MSDVNAHTILIKICFKKTFYNLNRVGVCFLRSIQARGGGRDGKKDCLVKY